MAISIRFLYEGEKYIFRFTKLSEVEVFLLPESMDCKKIVWSWQDSPFVIIL